MRGALNKGSSEFSFGKILGPDIVCQYGLPGLLGEHDDGQFARAEFLTVFENLKILKILDVYAVEYYLASRELGP